MPQEVFGQDAGVNTPKKILDAGPHGAFVGVQVLDASTLFFDFNREAMMRSGNGAALPNSNQGFQIKAAQGFVTFWMKGELWGLSDTANGLINAQILFKLKGKCGCDGGDSSESEDRPPALMDEV